MTTLIVRLVRHFEPLLVGLDCRVVQYDFCPFNQPSEEDPDLDLVVLNTGRPTHARLRDVVFVRRSA